MGQDNTPKIRQKAQLARKKSSRAVYERVLIVSEGSKTEPMYFAEIRAAKRLNTMNVAIYPSALGTEPSQVVAYAQHLFENGDSNKKISRRSFDKIFAVFDRDDHRTYFDALAQARSLDKKLKNDLGELVDFRAIVSIPCFEMWLLLHFEDIAAPLHRDEALERLRNHINDYEKGAGGSFEITSNRLEIACNRAELLAENQNEYGPPAPFTNIHTLVSMLLNLA